MRAVDAFGQRLSHVLLSVLACSALACGGPGTEVSPDAGPGEDAGAVLDAALGSDAALGTDAALPPGDAGRASRALFLGNSYTDFNELEQLYADVVASLGEPRPEVLALTPGGYRLAQHASDARTDGHAVQVALSEPSAWDVVTLQEQSQIPGFPESDPTFVESVGAAGELGALCDARGARVVLYQTWGRRDGDDTNPGLYPDFTTMQDRLSAGYRALATAAADAGADVRVAPVGEAFRRIHDGEPDPLDPAALFSRLYAGDGSHPSLAGSYLAACVIAAVARDADPRTIAYRPAGVDEADATRLLDAAAEAIAAESP